MQHVYRGLRLLDGLGRYESPQREGAWLWLAAATSNHRIASNEGRHLFRKPHSFPNTPIYGGLVLRDACGFVLVFDKLTTPRADLSATRVTMRSI